MKATLARAGGFTGWTPTYMPGQRVHGQVLGLVGLLAVGLRLNPREVPSPLVGKPAPDFEIAQLHEPDKTFSPQSMRGQVWLLNVWASWCVSCREEHPVLVDLGRSGAVPLVGRLRDATGGFPGACSPDNAAIATLRQAPDSHAVSHTLKTLQ